MLFSLYILFLTFVIYYCGIYYLLCLCVLHDTNILTYKEVNRKKNLRSCCLEDKIHYLKHGMQSASYPDFKLVYHFPMHPSQLAIHTSFITPSLFPLPELLFLYFLHLTGSYLVFRIQLKKDVLCEAFSTAPPRRIPSNLLLPPRFYGRCIRNSISVLLVSLICLSPCEKEPSPIVSSLFF